MKSTEDIKINKNSIYCKAVLESTLIFKIKRIAKSLFDFWVEHAKLRHPNHLFEANDEVLVDDLITAFAKGLEFIWRNENKTKRSTSGWSAGILLDIAGVTLNTHWSQEFIYKQTNEYKDLCYLTTLSQFLKADATALKKVEALYSHKVKKDINIIEQKPTKIVDLRNFKKNKKFGGVFEKNIINYLDLLYYEKHFHIFGDILKNSASLALVDFFSLDEMEGLVSWVKEALPLS